MTTVKYVLENEWPGVDEAKAVIAERETVVDVLRKAEDLAHQNFIPAIHTCKDSCSFAYWCDNMSNELAEEFCDAMAAKTGLYVSLTCDTDQPGKWHMTVSVNPIPLPSTAE